MDESEINNAFESVEYNKDCDSVPLSNIQFNKHKLKSKCSEFCRHTKIYGFTYLREANNTFERIFWISFILCSFFICTALLVKLVKSFNTPKIVTNIETIPIWDIPFPAITICPETKIQQGVYNFTEFYHKALQKNNQLSSALVAITRDEFKLFADASLVCDNHLFSEGNKTTDSEAIQHLINIAPSTEDMFFGCKFRSKSQKCDRLFVPQLTEDGLCFTFNMLDKKDISKNTNDFFIGNRTTNSSRRSGWSLEKGYSNDEPKTTYPERTTTSGTKGGFFIVLKDNEKHLDYICRGPVQGFKVFLHTPEEVPRINSHFIRIPHNNEVVISIKPKMTKSSQSLRSVDVNSRKCYFGNERFLKFFKSYTQENCISECLSNFTLHKCGCVAYHMPRNETTKVCGSANTICMFRSEEELLLREKVPICNCLPTCTSLSFDAEISQSDFHWEKVIEAFKNDVKEFPGIKLTRLTIFFKSVQFEAFSKDLEERSSIEILALIGGLLSLFTGVSLLLVAEIMYFILIKLLRT